MKVKPLILSLIAFGLVISPKTVLSHAIETFYQLNLDSFDQVDTSNASNSLEIQSTFGDGEVFKNAKIVIYAPNNLDTPWLEGTTDDNGEFVFNPDSSITGNWYIEIGEDSHWDRLIVPVKNDNIDFDQITYLEKPQLQHCHYNLADQLIVTLSAIGCVIGSRFLTKNLKN